jgi:outer membrane immunogenic protein
MREMSMHARTFPVFGFVVAVLNQKEEQEGANMTMPKILTTLGVTTLMGMGVASAADLAARPYTKAPPPVAAVFSWTGCYGGGSVGAAFGRSDFSWTDIQEVPTGFTAGAATVLPAAANARLSDTGVAAGVQVGCNYQTGALVFGGEADIQWTDIKTSRTATSLGNTNGGPATIVPGAISESLSSDWLSTFRGRVGYAWDRVLVYGTGGLAVANVRTFDQVCFPTAGIPGCNTASNSSTRTGWVAGGGIEWAFAPSWSIKGEYLYADLGNTGSQSILTTAAGATPFPLATINHNHNFIEQTARVGVNYRFNWGPLATRN